MTNVNVMDIIIVDLQGNEYDINDIKVEGNDVMTIRIKKPSEDYIPIGDLLNNQEETIQELLQYKYLVKALEEINKTYIEELISDWTDGAYSDKEEQLQLGKYHSENGLSWEDGDVE